MYNNNIFLKKFFFIDVYHYYKNIKTYNDIKSKRQQMNLNEYTNIYKLCFKFTFVQNFIFLLIFRKVFHFI